MNESTPQSEALIAALVEIERHVSASGWDQPARMFALVRTQALVDAEPGLADQLIVTAEDALSSIEQDGFQAGANLVETLAQIGWPASVEGCALACERTFLPPEYDGQIPEDPDEAVEFVNHHPARQDIRVVVGVLRDGVRHGVARLVTNPEDLLGAENLAPGLAAALAATLVPEPKETDR